MTDHAHELRRYARKIGHPAGDVPAVMLAAADEIERLQNVIIVSTGLPQMDARVRAMRRYHDENGVDGAFLCMTLPGMVRVIQSAGRLIRTQSDHGALLLIDSRYQRGAERALLSGTLIGDALSG